MQTITLAAQWLSVLQRQRWPPLPCPRNIKVFGQKHETVRRTFKTYFLVS